MSVSACKSRLILEVPLGVLGERRTKKACKRKSLGTDVMRIDRKKAAPRIQAERQQGIKIRAPNPSSFLAFEGELLPSIAIAFDAWQMKLEKMILQMDFAAQGPLGQFAMGQRRRVLRKPLLPVPPVKRKIFPPKDQHNVRLAGWIIRPGKAEHHFGLLPEELVVEPESHRCAFGSCKLTFGKRHGTNQFVALIGNLGNQVYVRGSLGNKNR